MSKTEAIQWCRDYFKWWPLNTMRASPSGWRWVSVQRPYKSPVITLVNAQHKEIFERDVFK